MSWLRFVEVLRPFEESACGIADRWALELGEESLGFGDAVCRSDFVAEFDEACEEVPKQCSILRGTLSAKSRSIY